MSEGGASDVVGIDSLIFSEYQLEPCEVAACAHKDGFNTVQLKDTPTKVYAIGAKLFLSKVPLEVLQN